MFKRWWDKWFGPQLPADSVYISPVKKIEDAKIDKLCKVTPHKTRVETRAEIRKHSGD